MKIFKINMLHSIVQILIQINSNWDFIRLTFSFIKGALRHNSPKNGQSISVSRGKKVKHHREGQTTIETTMGTPRCIGMT